MQIIYHWDETSVTNKAGTFAGEQLLAKFQFTADRSQARRAEKIGEN